MRYSNLTIFIFALWVSCSSETDNDRDVSAQPDVGINDTAHQKDSSFEWIEPKNHREMALSCVFRERPVGTTETCKDEECTGDQARCRKRNGYEKLEEFCTYDACTTDGDCDTNEVCECGSAKDLWILGPGADQNRCVQSNCTTDDDCGSAFCKASPDICGSGKIFGYFCTTQVDECFEDSDCGTAVCAFETQLSKWICNACD